ncbi:MAG: MerR family transcriptional regulator [Culturomica sp.]|jgi:DNA-binding transcriptional MerR regulator|nr:MerR family transcriptional regulator [Culturomica sp.]
MEEVEKTLPPIKVYYSIGEVAKMLNVTTSLIRFWEKEFTTIKPFKNKKGNRLFTKTDIDNLKLIYSFVKEQGMTLKGAQNKMSELKKSGDDNKLEIIKTLGKIKEELIHIKSQLP